MCTILMYPLISDPNSNSLLAPEVIHRLATASVETLRSRFLALHSVTH